MNVMLQMSQVCLMLMSQVAKCNVYLNSECIKSISMFDALLSELVFKEFCDMDTKTNLNFLNTKLFYCAIVIYIYIYRQMPP